MLFGHISSFLPNLYSGTINDTRWNESEIRGKLRLHRKSLNSSFRLVKTLAWLTYAKNLGSLTVYLFTLTV